MLCSCIIREYSDEQECIKSGWYGISAIAGTLIL